ncbi:MAG: DUF2066 domain-containing protein [Bdellovibrionales bacterium]
MRLPLILFAFLWLLAGPVLAQGGDAMLYEVSDVSADVTADSAAHARDQAIAEAQRTALEQLLSRLGADSSLAGEADDDTIAALVKNFEVQNERTSSVRYIGVFTVHFRPAATREWLERSGTAYTETRSRPILILPIYMSSGHPVLWEEHTRWWSAWENARGASLVPVMLPSGGLDDIALLSTEEAASGDAESVKALIEKYQAGGAAVVTLNGDIENPGAPYKITVKRFDTEGNSGIPTYLNLPAAADKAAIDNALAQAVRQSHNVLENSWRQVVARSTQSPAEHLPVVVPIDSLDEWTSIKRKLNNVRSIERVNVITLARGTTNIEIEFRGGIEPLQGELEQHGLTLVQDMANGVWTLQTALSETPL